MDLRASQLSRCARRIGGTGALQPPGPVGEDEERRAEQEIQALTDQFVAEIDKVLDEKEKELMEF